MGQLRLMKTSTEALEQGTDHSQSGCSSKSEIQGWTQQKWCTVALCFHLNHKGTIPPRKMSSFKQKNGDFKIWEFHLQGTGVLGKKELN